MEDVWKDISLSHHHPTPPSSSPTYRGIILQDFLASAAVPQPQTPSPPPPPSSVLPTALSLSSSHEFPYLSCSSHRSNSCSGDDTHDTALIGPFPAPATISPYGSKKRSPGGPGGSAADCDPRHKRMIKNRESAARSRARKQAYANELELALLHLQRENEMLRKQQEELNLRLAMAAQDPDRPTIQRSRSCPL